MDEQSVMENFMLLSELSREEAEPWRGLCHWAIASVFARLQKEVDLIAWGEALSYAIATMVYYKYTLRRVAQNGSTVFSAGDVKLTERTDDILEAAEILYKEGMASVAHLFEDEVVLLGVKA